MKNQKWTTFLLLLTIFCAGLAQPVQAKPNTRPAATPAGDNQLSMESVTAAPNSTGSFNVSLNNSDVAAALQLVFTYDSTIGLDITAVQPVLRAAGFTTNFSKNASNPASVRVTILLFTLGAPTIAAGTGAILQLSYTTTPTAQGSTPLGVNTALLSNKSGQPLTVTVSEGAFKLTLAPRPSTVYRCMVRWIPRCCG
jgi:hypothetical protein